MTDPGIRWISTCALLCAFAWPSLQAQSRRLYVEPFSTKAGAEKLREDLTAELRKSGSLSLAGDQTRADLILGGGGEVWVRGYQSLNPRSGRMPSNGTPVYGGFLSVELRNTKGETLWSYLVTPAAPSTDITKDLSKQIAKHVTEAVLAWKAPDAPAAPPQPAAILKGAGATFPAPLYSKWLLNYRRANPAVELSYEPVGSETGIRRLLSGDVDFGASDNPEAVSQLAPRNESDYLLFPSAIGAVVPIVNLPGFSGEISFTPEALAGIYLGKITKWNDPLLKQANPHVSLPGLDITVVHRSDGSGTSYVWTDYLSKTSPEWREQAGTAMAPKWPLGRSAAGNEGVAEQVKERGGAIGYVEYIYALQNHLTFGKVRNRSGEFVDASLESIGLAARNAMDIGDALKFSIVDSPGAGSYPISSFTWLVVPSHIADDTKRKALMGFLQWVLGPGQTQAAALGYLGLPKDLIAREEQAISRIH